MKLSTGGPIEGLPSLVVLRNKADESMKLKDRQKYFKEKDRQNKLGFKGGIIKWN